MNTIMQGDSYYIPITIKDSTGVYVTTSTADDVEVVINNTIKSYSNGEITFQNNQWLYPITQEESFNLSNRLLPVQVRVKFKSGDVIGKDLGNLALHNSISKEVL